MRALRATRLAMMLSACAATALWSPLVFSFSYVTPSDEALYRESEGVLVATVVSELEGASGTVLPQRRYQLSVERVLLGPPRAGLAVLRLPGTPSDAKRVVFLPGIPELQTGERVLVFYESGPDGELRSMQLSLGLFFEVESQTGQRAYVRETEGAQDLGKSRNAAYSLPRDADRFERWIADGARGSAFDYFTPLTQKVGVRGLKFNPSFSSRKKQVRWFEFDTGGSVTWRAMVGQPAGSSFTVDLAIANGQGAWTNDPDSRIDLRYNPTRLVSDPGNNSADGVNGIVWDDPGNDIGGSFDCGTLTGVIGVGGPFFNPDATTRFDGTEYHRITEGFLIGQDNIGCFLSSDTIASEFFAHEFGHTLGFAHACGDFGQVACTGNPVLDDATMRGRLHADGRGGALREDDRAAARHHYPSPSYEHPQERMVDALSTAFTGCAGGGSSDASASADGSVVVFQTTCTPTKVGRPGQWKKPAPHDGVAQIYVLDRRTQCLRKASVSDGSDGLCGSLPAQETKAEPITLPAIEPSISADGRYAVFVAPSGAFAQAHGETPKARAQRLKGSGWEVWMRDLISNITYQVSSASATGAGTQPQLAPDGQSITFISDTLPETAPGEISDPTPDAFQIKPNPGGPGNGFGPPQCISCKDAPFAVAGPPAVSANGGLVALTLGGQLWLQNILSGVSQQMTFNQAPIPATVPSLSYAGDVIAFESPAPLDADGSDDNGKVDVYILEPCCNKVTRVSKPDVELLDPNAQEPSLQPMISGNGKFVTFKSKANNLMGFEPELNPNEEVYVYEVPQQQRRRYSRTTSGAQSNGPASRPWLSYGGNLLLFDSAATNLDGADGNGVQDVFVRSNVSAEFYLHYHGFE